MSWARGFWGLDENPLGVVGIVYGGVAAGLFQMVDETFNHRDGIRFVHGVLFSHEFESFCVVAKVDAHFATRKQLAEDACGVGIRESETKSVLLDFVRKQNDFFFAWLGICQVEARLFETNLLGGVVVRGHTSFMN